jgi:hypothetical protein
MYANKTRIAVMTSVLSPFMAAYGCTLALDTSFSELLMFTKLLRMTFLADCLHMFAFAMPWFALCA